MSNTLRLTFRSLYYPLKRDVLKLTPLVSAQSARTLYAKSSMAIDAFQNHQIQTKNQMENIEQKFRERMTAYATQDSTSMIFTEDLKNMIHLAENDDDFALVIKMAKKFNGQNKQLRFGNFVFGPVLMRMFHVFNKADLALECFKSPELNGIFDQLITYQILLDLLYESGKYQEMLEVFEIIKSKQLQGAKYPRNVIVLTMAACYKLNSKESAEYALNLWNELLTSGHSPMRRATTFCAGLALNQGRPEVALEILTAVNKPNYVTVRNLKLKALSEIGRLEDAIVILKSVLMEDQPGEIAQTFNKDVLECVKEAVAKSENSEISLEFNKLEELFRKEGHISEMTLDAQLCTEIQQVTISKQTREQGNTFNRYNKDQFRNRVNTYDRGSNRGPRRPGLSEMI